MSGNEHPIQGLMSTAMQKIREMVDVNTIIGDPITTPNNTVIIPVSKVSFGFASGGSDFPSKTQQDLFGGGSGAGITIQPLAFLVVTDDGHVELVQMSAGGTSADRMISMVPELINKIAEMFPKKGEKKSGDPASGCCGEGQKE